MKKMTTLACMLLATTVFVAAQPKPKPKSKPPTQAEMNKMLEAAMKQEGMSKEEQAEMKKIMSEVMPAMIEQKAVTANYPAFTSNRDLVPARDVARISSVSKKAVASSEIGNYAAGLYTKIMAKGKPAEISLVKQILAKATKSNDISAAAITAMLQGHAEAAMALSMKAVQLSPANPNYQNNMAALLTQYGYAEQAIPVLRKIRKEFPGNSTVLNNLAHAWLSLGEKDSVKIYANGAIMVNPSHPEAMLCGGLMDEIMGGDPIDKYTGAMENAINPFTEQVLKNKNEKATLDYEKLKGNITYNEYFPKDWIKIPKLSDNVSGYENDRSIKNGYSKMFEELQSKIDALKEASESEINALVNQGQDVFVKEMRKENAKGISMMSKPASVVQTVLQTYIADWMNKYQKESVQLIKNMEAKKAAMTKSDKNDKCPEWDRKNNEFLSYANPIIRKFHEKKIEEFRTWLNMHCTWIWYLTGNPKNTVMIQCVAWTEALKEFYQHAMEGQYAIAKSCTKQSDDGKEMVETPEIPNFTCPAVVGIPSGTEWNELSNTAKNFDANKYGIKQSASPIPNVSVAYGVGSMIAQPGIAPFIKTANGSITPVTGSEELTSIPTIEKGELVSIPKIPLEELTPLPNIPKGEELTALPDLRKSIAAKELLKKMMQSDCKKVRNSKDLFKEAMDKMMKNVKELDAIVESKKSISKMKQMADEMESTTTVLKDIQQNGLQPSISNGAQVPGTFTGNKGLFK